MDARRRRPDGVLGFKLAVDQTRPERVYAATGGGLFRSTDAGASFTNVDLPTGDCARASRSRRKDCFLANVVTDVVVQGPANAQHAGPTPARRGARRRRLARRHQAQRRRHGAVAEQRHVPLRQRDPGTFQNLDFAGNSTPIPPDALTQARIGRIALGIADGADQDHRVVYALVQDAVKFNGGVAGLDANENGTTSPAQSDYLNGLWASTDFGKTWRSSRARRRSTTTRRATRRWRRRRARRRAVISYCPGVQAWYNLWVQPDPAADRVGRPDAARVRPRGGLAGRSLRRPRRHADEGERRRPLLRAARRARCSTPPTGCRSARSPTGGTMPKTTTHPDQHG